MPGIDKGIDFFYPCLFLIITFIIAVEFYLIYVDWYVYYNNKKKFILKGLF